MTLLPVLVGLYAVAGWLLLAGVIRRRVIESREARRRAVFQAGDDAPFRVDAQVRVDAPVRVDPLELRSAAGRRPAQVGSEVCSWLLVAVAVTVVASYAYSQQPVAQGPGFDSLPDGLILTVLALFCLVLLTPVTIAFNVSWTYNFVTARVEAEELAAGRGARIRYLRILAYVVWLVYLAAATWIAVLVVFPGLG